MTTKQVIIASILTGLAQLTSAVPIRSNFAPLANHSLAAIVISDSRLKKTIPYNKKTNLTTNTLTGNEDIADVDIAQLKFADNPNRYGQAELFIGNSSPDAMFVFNWGGQAHYAAGQPTPTAAKILPGDWVVNYALVNIPEPTELPLIAMAAIMGMISLRYQYLSTR